MSSKETVSLPVIEHPALAPFDITGFKGASDKNLFEIDLALQRVVKQEIQSFPKEHQSAIWNHLKGYGELTGGVLNDLTTACHKEGKYGEVVKYDRTGNRIDEIVYSPEQVESRKISFDYGIVNLDFHPEWKYNFPHIHRYALAYLNNLNGEGGVACPLAMTDGLILALKKIAPPEIKERFFPLLTDPKSKSHFMAGQYVTERVGGSNVGANRTTAKKKEDGTWVLNGEKWFCSNPGDLWVTTAKIEGTQTVGMFLVSRFKRDGCLNGHHILRKKDIIGSRGKVTAEIIYKDVEAEELGRPSHGLVNLIQYIIQTSRIHVGIGSCGNSRRALLEALEYAKVRTAYEKKIEEFPILATQLADLVIDQTLMTFANFASILLWEKENPLFELTTPLMKYISSSTAARISHESILCMGGNGIIGDFSPLPRLLNDSIINESWEGTHLLITDHVLRALQKRKIFNAFVEWVHTHLNNSENNQNQTTQQEKIQSHILESMQDLTHILQESPRSYKELNRVSIANLVYQVFSETLLFREIHQDKGEGIYSDMAEVYFQKKWESPSKKKYGMRAEISSSVLHRILQYGRGSL